MWTVDCWVKYAVKQVQPESLSSLSCMGAGLGFGLVWTVESGLSMFGTSNCNSSVCWWL